MSVLALPLIAVGTLRATTFEVGVLTAASTVAFLVVGLPAGAWLDRVRRRPVMIAADVGRLAALGSVPVAYAVGRLGLVQLYLVALVSGSLTVAFDVAYQSYLPSLVGRDHLVEGNAKLAASAQVAQVAGPSLAGGLVEAIGGPFAVAVDAGSFLVSAVATGAIRAVEAAPPARGEHAPSLRREIAEGLRFVFGHRVLRAIAATTATSNLFSGVGAAVEIVFLVRTVHASAALIGLVFAGGSVGGLLAAFVASKVARRIGGVRATLAGVGLTAGAVLEPLTTRGAGLVLFAGGFFLVSFGAVLYNVNQLSFRQRLCPDRLLGRMNATMRFVIYGVLPIGAIAGGAIGTLVGTRATLWVAVAGQALAGAWLVASPARRMRDFPEG